MIRRVAACLIPLALSAAAMSSAYAQIQTHSPVQANTSHQDLSLLNEHKFDQFTRYSETQFMQLLDFSVWDSLLHHLVIYGGPVDRKYAGHRHALTGSRIKWGHRSAYRLEGNKVPFTYLSDDMKRALSLHREELIAYIETVDLTRLSKNEWLAVWYNLHNAVLADELALNYPVQTPRELIPEGYNARLHDAKLLTLKGTPLSLRDIREKIVYPTVKDPNVIYGFWLGDLGSPSLSQDAFEASLVNALLEENAYEFINGRRGYNWKRDKQYVSQIYYDTAVFFFPDFERDLGTHLEEHFVDKLSERFAKGGPILPDSYHDTISDLAGGQKPRIHSGNVTVNGNVPKHHSVEMILRELKQKTEGRNTVKGTVTIEDIKTQ